MWASTKRFFERKLKKLEYTKTRLPEGYEEVTIVYKKVRDELTILMSVASSLSTYEYGGTMFKNISHWANTLSSKTAISAIKPQDEIYSNISIVFKKLSNDLTLPSSSINTTNPTKTQSQQPSDTTTDKQHPTLQYSKHNTDMAQQYLDDLSRAYSEMAEEKQKMNQKLFKVVEQLKELKEKTKKIDQLRSLTADARYDAEELLQKTVYKTEEKEKVEKRLKELSEKSMSEMREFTSLKSITECIGKITEAHSEFSSKSAKLLSCGMPSISASPIIQPPVSSTHSSAPDKQPSVKENEEVDPSKKSD